MKVYAKKDVFLTHVLFCSGFITPWSYCNDYYEVEEPIVHEGEKPFKCKICEESFSTNYFRKKHITSVHEEGKIFFQSTYL